MPDYSLSDIITTLITNGFNIQKVDRFANSTNIVQVYKFDKLGAKVIYQILFTNDVKVTAVVDTLILRSGQVGATPIVVADHFIVPDCKTFKFSDFYSIWGGIISTGLILVPNLSDVLNDLGHNRLYPGLSGNPDDLHELYVKESLQFIMQSPTRRYGIDRAFESLPDVVVLSKNGFMLLVDSKAYSSGYKFKSDDLKRFTGYVNDFGERYSAFFGRVLSFIVISGSFNDSLNSMRERSDEFYKMSGCKLSCLTSIELGKIVGMLNTEEELRKSIIWKNIFTELKIDSSLIVTEIKRIQKDNLH